MATIFTYPFADFVSCGGKPNPRALVDEIADAILITGTVTLKGEYQFARFDFASDLSPADEASLDTLVAAHTAPSLETASLDAPYELRARCPANAGTLTPGAGNVDVIDVPQFKVLVPNVAGTGRFTVDLTAAGPIPAASGDGYWMVASNGDVLPAAPGAGTHHLLTVEVVLQRWQGQPHRSWELELTLERPRFKVATWRRKQLPPDNLRTRTRTIRERQRRT